MIDIDVFVAGVRKWYEFQCDDTKKSGEIAEKICEIVQKKEGIDSECDKKNIWLCSIEQQRVLDGSRSLKEENIINGMRLILV